MSEQQKKIDNQFMKTALTLAKKGLGFVSPNPAVGCVITKDNKIIARGYHHQAGTAHAEINALQQINYKAKGCTAYVTLEPCNHYGRTPPCSEALIKAGITRVVIASIDTNPDVTGGGIGHLRKHGVAITTGIREHEARRLNEIFFYHSHTHKPFIALKIAQSLDGATATASKKSKWITSSETRLHSHQFRHYYDAIMVGANTVRLDNPLLNCRLPNTTQPKRIIVTISGNLPQQASIFSNTSQQATIIITSAANKKLLHSTFCNDNISIIGCRINKGGISIPDMLNKLYQHDITSILVEGGAYIIGSFIDARIFQKLHLYQAPMLIGGQHAQRSIGGKGAYSPQHASKLHITQIKQVGPDIYLEAYPHDTEI